MTPRITQIRDSAIVPPVVTVTNTSDELKEVEFDGTWASTLNSTLTLPTNGASSLGFHLDPAENSTVVFEGSWDDDHWTDITMRQMGAHGYASYTSEHEDWIGSCSAFSSIRMRTTTAGTGSHVAFGKFTRNPSTLEGIEHGNQPHRIGASVQAKTINFDAGGNNQAAWTPASGHRLVISDIHYTVTDATTVVTFSDGSLAQALYVQHGHYKPPSNESVQVNISFALPHVMSAINRPLMFSQTGKASVIGVVHGYETE